MPRAHLVILGEVDSSGWKRSSTCRTSSVSERESHIRKDGTDVLALILCISKPDSKPFLGLEGMWRFPRMGHLGEHADWAALGRTCG